MSKMARLCLLAVACLVTLSAKAQVGSISGQVVDQNGTPLPNVLVRVCSATSTNTPCTPTVPIFADYGLTQPLGNPTAVDSYGNYTFFVPALAAPNLYTIQFSPNSGITWQYVQDGPVNGAPTIQACSQVGADAGAQINAAAASLPVGGGVVDTTCYGATEQVIGEPLTALDIPLKPVHLSANSATRFDLNYAFSPSVIASSVASGVSGRNGACLVPIATGSSILTPGWNQPPVAHGYWHLGPAAATYDVFCNADQDGTQESLSINGLGIIGNITATMSGSLLHIKRVFVSTLIENTVTYNPYGNAVTVDGGSDNLFINDNFNDSGASAQYAGAVLTLNCVTDFTMVAGAVQFNGPYNPMILVNGYNPQMTECPLGTSTRGIRFYNVDIETRGATVGTFPGAATNVDPIQLTDSGFVLIDNMQQYGSCGAGQNHLVDLLSTGSNGQLRGPVEINNVSAGTSCFVGKSLIHNTNGAPYVSLTLADVFGTQNDSGLTIGQYKWEGNGAVSGSSIDYEDFKNFSSLISGIDNGSFVVGTNFPTIQGAFTQAGVTGSVIIPPGYTGADSWVNPNNVRLADRRPYNPTNGATYNGHSPMPQTTIKAADYGALCNGDGVHDDTAAIQAAINANATIIGGAGGGTNFMDGGAVELPQGRCQISSTLKLVDYGSLIGTPGQSWIFPLEPWLGTSNGDLVDITTSYSPNGPGGLGHGGGYGRQVRGIMFEYNFNATAHTAINVISGYGHTPTTPYSSSQNNPQAYQINNVTIADDYIFAMDQGILLTDCGDCNVFNVWISNVRTGIAAFNSYGISTSQNTIIGGSTGFTPNTGTTSGVYTSSISLSYCNGGTGANCIGGTLQNIIGSPQGFGVNNTQVESGWGVAANFVNLLGLVWHNSCACDSTIGMFLGNIYGPQITDSSISTRDATGPAVSIAAPASTPGSGEAVDNGWTFINNTVSTDNNSSGTANGVILQAGTAPLVNLIATGNHFFGFNHAMVFNAPLINSVLVGNYGDGNTGALIQLNAAGAGSFNQTVIHDNTSRDTSKIILDTAGGGMVIGYNASGNPTFGGQLTGTQIASGPGCTTGTTAGVGVLCPLTIPNTYFTAPYVVTGCQVIGASAQVHTGLVVYTNGTAFSVYEIPDTTSAASGGVINCTVYNSQ